VSGAAAPETPADGLWGFLLLAIGAGGAALLTPCVFPMIPLTVSYFTKHADSRAESVRMASLYGVSIVATFTGLGVAMAALVGASGAQSIAANPWVNLFIGLTFVVFALSLLGLFELRLPSGLVNYVNRQGNERGGGAGVVFMGLTLTLVSFSCTAPFVGGLLAATAGGAWVFPVFGMVAFSATFALPFIGFAMFPKALDSLPQSGAWMNAVKVTLGFVELAAALKFLSNADLVWGTNLLSRPLAIALTVVLFALAGFYLLGKVRLKDEPVVEHIGSLRLLAATAFLGLALYMVPGLLGAPLGALDAYLPPRTTNDVGLLSAVEPSTGTSTFDWHTDDIDGAFAEAESANKPVFIDFTGYTCTNCRDMEANVFPKPPVAEQLRSRYVLLRLYTDDLPDGATFQRYQLRLTGTTALPTYAIVDPHDRTLLRTTSGTLSVERFAAFLQDGAAQYADRQPLAAR
jgi:thiol:disulfide interchange protein DsbD